MKKNLIYLVFLIFALACSSLYAANYTNYKTTFTCSAILGTIESPVINHSAPQSIFGLNIPLKLQGVVIAPYIIPKVFLYYKINNNVWNKVTMTVEDIGNKTYAINGDIGGENITSAGTLYYYIEALDPVSNLTAYWQGKNINNPQAVPIIVNTSVYVDYEGGTVSINGLNNMPIVQLIFPRGALTMGTTIEINQKRVEQAPTYQDRKAAFVYEFLPSGLAFSKPVELKIMYNDVNNDGKEDSLPSGFNDVKNLRVYYLNGADWDLIGGLVDLNAKTVATSLKHFSTYGLFYTILNRAAYMPKYRIITPNGDGFNDVIKFINLDNVNTEIKIFDVNGRKVRSISQRPYEWDGKDGSGRVVESGLYIYQFKVAINGKDEYINGTLAVAK